MKSSKRSTDESRSKSRGEDESKSSGLSASKSKESTRKNASRKQKDNPKSQVKDARSSSEKESRRKSTAPHKRGSSVEKKKKPGKNPLKRRTSIDDMDYDLEGLVMRRHSNEREGVSSSGAGKSKGKKGVSPKETKGKNDTSSRRLSDGAENQRRKKSTLPRHHSLQPTRCNSIREFGIDFKDKEKPSKPEGKKSGKNGKGSVLSLGSKKSQDDSTKNNKPPGGRRTSHESNSSKNNITKKKENDKIKLPAPPRGVSRRSSDSDLGRLLKEKTKDQSQDNSKRPKLRTSDKDRPENMSSRGLKSSTGDEKGKGKLPAPPRGISRRSSETSLGRLSKGWDKDKTKAKEDANGPKLCSLFKDRPENKSTRGHRSSHGSEGGSLASSKNKEIDKGKPSASNIRRSASKKNLSSSSHHSEKEDKLKKKLSRNSSESGFNHQTRNKSIRLSLDENDSREKSQRDLKGFELKAPKSRRHTKEKSSSTERKNDARPNEIKKRKRISKKAMRKRERAIRKRGREFASSISGIGTTSGRRSSRGDPAAQRRRKSSTSRSSDLRRGAEGGKNGTATGEGTSELESSNREIEGFASSRRLIESERSQRTTVCMPQSIKRGTCRLLSFVLVLIFLVLAVGATLFFLKTLADEKETEAPPLVNDNSTNVDDAGSEAPTPVVNPRGSIGLAFTVDIPSYPSAIPSVAPTEHTTTTAPIATAPIAIAPATSNPVAVPSPVVTMAIAVIIQLDSKPEETGFSLISLDHSTTYISKPIGSLAGLHNEVVMEVVNIQEKIEVVFEVTDESGDGLCCTHGNGYFRVLAGTGDQKVTLISGEQSAKYVFTVGRRTAAQIGGVDPNEYCKLCPDGKECGRCAWCNADEGFKPDEIYSWQCHSNPKPITKKCFVGSKRFRFHNQYVAAMAKCPNGFEAWPQIETSPDTTVCVEEAKCIKMFDFVEPNCDEVLSGSLLVKETCQDKIGGFAFGYSWGLNAPREKECPSTRDFAESLAPRCCQDQVAFCSGFLSSAEEEDASAYQETPSPTPMAVITNTYAPTMSHAPTYDGYPITLLIQLDDFPKETGFSITTKDRAITFLERRQGYYKKPQLLVENVQIPEGIEAVLTITDKGGDGICCENGRGYFQVYSDQGSLILDESGIFLSEVKKVFLVGEPQTLPPTVSTSPTVSVAPSFDVFPITIAVQLDQWSDETGFSIQSVDGSYTYFDWPAGSFLGQSSSLIVETVYLPRDNEVNFRITDKGGDGFCCLYGNGHVKIFAGESAEDESALLASESAEFESDLSIKFRAGPAPSVSPATTASPTVSANKAPSSGSTSSNWCDNKADDASCAEVTLVMQLDKFSAETSWFINSGDGSTNFVTRPDGYYEEMPSQTIIESVYLPDNGSSYQFKIVDFMGDGTCCWAGNGWYSLYRGSDVGDASTQLFYGKGDFGRERTHEFFAGKMPVQNTAPQLSVTKYAIEVTIKFDSYSSQTGWYISSEDGEVIIDRQPGYYSGNDESTIDETVRLEAGEYQFSVVDSNGDGFCCLHGVGYYSLMLNGEILLYEQGRFEFSHKEAFSVPNLPAASYASSRSNSDLSLRGALLPPYKPKRQREHANHEK